MSNRIEHSHHPQKLKALFSCGIFRNCAQTKAATAAPPAATTASLPPPLPPPRATQLEERPEQTPEKPKAVLPSSSSSSSSSTSQSFTQWRFPLSHPPENRLELDDLQAAEIQLSSGNRISGLRLIERSLAQDPAAATLPYPPSIISGVIVAVQDPTTTRSAAKVLLALLLFEGNRKTAVESGAVAAALEAIAAVSTSGVVAAERALAALELMCTVPEGAAEVRRIPYAAGVLTAAAEKMVGRGRECAIGVLAAVYSGEWAATAPPEAGKAVVAALQGDCTARGRRKGGKLLKALKESGQLDLPED